MKNITNVMLGSDPEAFVFNDNTQKFVSAIGLVGAGKWNPKKLSQDGYMVLEDNVLIEFNIPPASTKEQFITNLITGVDLIQKEVLNGKPHLSLRMQGSAFMPASELEDPKAHVFGCEPDQDAWNDGKDNHPPDSPSDGLRSAGLHIHVGYDPIKAYRRGVLNKQLARWMDLYLAIPSMISDPDPHRRKLYGKAGSYRDKEYGMEYRVLSGKFLANPIYMGWMWDQTMRAVDKVDEGQSLGDPTGERIKKAVNTCDMKEVEALIREYDLVVA